jgi:predicted Zn-dependent peptidase
MAVAGAAAAQDISYEKYKLDNGMTVILREDHSLPVGALNIWYRVGAKDEPPGRSGFAHLYEHLMFMGTERVPGNSFDTIMEAGGGANNASTSFDRTNYYSSGPASLLPTLLWLDADRLEDLARTMDQAKLDRQRDVVRNEIRQNVENRPYGKAEEYVYRLMYPKGHPYHEAVYGTHEDLESATVTNVKDFFATYYVPSNASLVVAGDFDSAKIKPLIAQLFGSLPRGGDVAKRTVEPARLDRVIRTTMVDKVQLPMVKMVWHSPVGFADGDAECDLIAAVLSRGKNSRLYKRLVFDEKIAVDVSARQESAGLGSLFVIEVQGKPGADLERIEKAVDEELARLAAQGVESGELEERKATIELGKLAQLQSVESVADKLNEYEYTWGEPNSFKRDLDRYRESTPAKVQFWAKRVLDPSARAIVRVLPEQPEHTASGRDKRPQDFAPSQFTPAAPETFALSNGLPIMLWRKPELPLVGMQLVFKSPGTFDPPERAGLATLAAQMTEEGAGDLNALQFAAALQGLGATYSAGAGQETAIASMTVLKRNFEKAAALAADALLRPRNTEEDWARVKSLHLDELKQQDDEPTVVAARVGLRALFGMAIHSLGRATAPSKRSTGSRSTTSGESSGICSVRTPRRC